MKNRGKSGFPKWKISEESIVPIGFAMIFISFIGALALILVQRTDYTPIHIGVIAGCAVLSVIQIFTLIKLIGAVMKSYKELKEIEANAYGTPINGVSDDFDNLD